VNLLISIYLIVFQKVDRFSHYILKRLFKMAPTLGYWNIRGLAQPIRLLLAYTETEVEDKRYTQPDEWFGSKFNLGLDFPNLPYYIDGDVKLSQSLAILRYLARQKNLVGASEAELIRIELFEQQLVDLNTEFVRLSYNPEFETLKVDYLKNLPASLQLLSTFLGERPYLAGDNLSYVDFIAYELLDKLLLLANDEVVKFDNFKQYLARFEALPTIAAYLKSDRFLKSPINGPTAKFGGN